MENKALNSDFIIGITRSPDDGTNCKIDVINVLKLKNQEIEKLAWQIFIDELGLSFKRELNDEEKRSVVGKDSFHRYLDKAEKVYAERLAKKEKAVLNKKYLVIDVPASGKPTWMGGAYVLCFVYSRYKGNFVLRGYYKEVQEYLKANYTHYFYNMSLWHHGNNRDIWNFWKDDVGVHQPHRYSRIFKGKDRWKFQVKKSTNWQDSEEVKKNAEDNSFYFKRMPKRWIPEFNTL